MYKPFIARIVFLLFYFYCFAGYSQSVNWKLYNVENSDLPDNSVYSISIDPSGAKWLGSKLGLVKFDKKKFHIYNKKVKKEVQYTIVRSITIDPDGVLWTGTWGDGMAQLTLLPIGDGTFSPSWISYRENNSAITHNTVKSIVIDQTGNKWIGTEEGLVLMENLEWGFGGLKWKTFYTDNSGLSHNSVYAVCVDKFNNKWFGTFGGGISKFDGQNWTIHDVRNSGLPDNYITSMIIDKKQKIWSATYNGGLVSYNGEEWKTYTTTNSGLPDNVVSCMVVDGKNNLWVGTDNSGLAKFDGSNWVVFDIMDAGFTYNINALSVDSKGNILIGTNKGLVLFNEKGVK